MNKLWKIIDGTSGKSIVPTPFVGIIIWWESVAICQQKGHSLKKYVRRTEIHLTNNYQGKNYSSYSLYQSYTKIH